MEVSFLIANRDCIITKLKMDNEIYIEMPLFDRLLNNKTVYQKGHIFLFNLKLDNNTQKFSCILFLTKS